MKTHLILFGILCLCMQNICAFPNLLSPKLEYEMITDVNQTKTTWGREDAALTPLTTKRPVIAFTTTPITASIDSNSKTFIYDSKTKTWSLIRTNALPSDTNTLVWNQSNDKWLTQPVLT